MSDSLWPHGLQHTRLPCPSPTPGVYSNSSALIPSKHLILCPPLLLLPSIFPSIRSEVKSLSLVQLFATPWTVAYQAPLSTGFSGSFQMSQFFASGGQSIGVPASAAVLPMNSWDWFPLRWTGWIALLSKGLSRVFSNTTVQKYQY